MVVTAVALPPGRLKLATSPSSTGSTPVANTTGVTEIAARMARMLTSMPPAKITATLRPTRSAAKFAVGQRESTDSLDWCCGIAAGRADPEARLVPGTVTVPLCSRG